MEEFVIRKSSIKLPVKQTHPKIAITGGDKDEVVITGYVKQTFATSEFEELSLPPVYITQIIERYYNVGTLHWISKSENNHFTICVKDILTNLL